jgi:dephospho-CoA kinase
MIDKSDTSDTDGRTKAGRPNQDTALPRMRRWVVTGPLGAGKSLVTRILVEHGAVPIEGDAIGHELLRLPTVIDQIRQEFGGEVLQAGQVDREALGRVVFADPASLARLNAITLPQLAVSFQERFDQLAASGRWALAVLEAAVYFLLPSMEHIDLTIAVVASPALREERLLARDRWSRDEIRRRIAAQQDWERYWSRADVLLANEGTTDALESATLELLAQHLGGER